MQRIFQRTQVCPTKVGRYKKTRDGVMLTQEETQKEKLTTGVKLELFSSPTPHKYLLSYCWKWAPADQPINCRFLTVHHWWILSPVNKGTRGSEARLANKSISYFSHRWWKYNSFYHGVCYICVSAGYTRYEVMFYIWIKNMPLLIVLINEGR